MNCGQAIDRRLDRDLDAVVLILPNPSIRLCRKGKNGMLHRGHVSLWNSIENIADEEVALRIPIWQERGANSCALVSQDHSFRTFTHATAGLRSKSRRFVLSHTLRQLSYFYTRSFVLSHTKFRTFTHRGVRIYHLDQKLTGHFFCLTQSLTHI